MSLIGLPALAIVIVLAYIVSTALVRLGSPDARGFLAVVWWAVFVAELVRAAGIFDAIAGGIA